MDHKMMLSDWLPINSAPKDGTILRLKVLFDDNPLEDDASVELVTIGHNAFCNTGEDQWQFVGWDWTHDCYTQGTGVVTAWMPLVDIRILPTPLPIPPAPAGLDDVAYAEGWNQCIEAMQSGVDRPIVKVSV